MKRWFNANDHISTKLISVDPRAEEFCLLRIKTMYGQSGSSSARHWMSN